MSGAASIASHGDGAVRAIDVLMIVEAEFATTHLIELVLKACAPHGITYRKRLLSQLTAEDFSPGSVPLFIRCGDPSLPDWLQLLAEARRPYLYYLDDNFWKIEGDTPLAHYYRHPSVRYALNQAVRHAHSLVVNSPELARFLTSFSSAIEILPPFFDFGLIEAVRPEPSDEIRIGFAGSLLRVADLEIVQPIVAPLLEAHPRAVFEFAGVMPRGMAANERLRFFPHIPDYDTYIRFQASRGWAIGLAPLLDTEANRCKTDNKYREYGACRIAGLYSAIAPYRHSVRNGETGLLLGSSPSEWLEALNLLIMDHKRRSSMGEMAFQDVHARYKIETVAPQWADLFRTTKQSQKSHRPLASNPHLPAILRSRLARWRLGAAIAYHEGGLALVLRKTIEKVGKAIGAG